MGCDCCKIMTPEQYEKCNALDAELTAKKKSRISLCGGTTIGYTGGSNYTPPKPKKKRKRKK